MSTPKKQPPKPIPNNTNDQPGVNADPDRDPHLYDPMGMAGKPAGIIQELKEAEGEQRSAEEAAGKPSPKKRS